MKRARWAASAASVLLALGLAGAVAPAASAAPAKACTGATPRGCTIDSVQPRATRAEKVAIKGVKDTGVHANFVSCTTTPCLQYSGRMQSSITGATGTTLTLGVGAPRLR